MTTEDGEWEDPNRRKRKVRPQKKENEIQPATYLEIEEIENGCTEKKIINDIDFKIDNIEENIESIYEEYMDKLNNLVGLSDVKKEIKKLVDYLEKNKN